MATFTTDKVREQDHPSRGLGGPARLTAVSTVSDHRSPVTAGASTPPSHDSTPLLSSPREARKGGEADRLGKNTNSVSKTDLSHRPAGLVLSVAQRQQEQMLRLYGLRWTAQDVLGGVLDGKVEGKRYDHESGEVVAVEDGKWHRQIGCGNRRIQEFVGLRKNKGGSHYFDGVLTCGSIWPCPVCSFRIRRKRASEIQDAAVRWVSGSVTKGRLGGTLVFVTITLRHTSRDRLEQLFAVVQEAFGKKGIWATGAMHAKRKELGWQYQIRSTEITVGKNGWHPHLHMLGFLTQQELTPARLESIRTVIWDRWAAILDREGLPSIRSTWGQEHAVKVEAVRNSDDLAKYLCKVEGMDAEAEGGWGVGNEMARGDLKKGRMVENHKTSSLWEVLEVVQSHKAGRTCAKCYNSKCPILKQAHARFLNYVDVTRAKRAIEWSPGLKKLLDIGEVDDEVLADESTDDDFEAIVADFSPSDWRIIIKHRAQAKILIAANARGAEGARQVLDRLSAPATTVEQLQRAVDRIAAAVEWPEEQ